MSSQVTQNCKLALILSLLVFVGCSGGDRHTGFYSVGDPSKGEFNKVVTVSNAGSTDASVRLSIKGFLFGSKEELLEYISSMPDLYAGEPSYEKAWRFMTKRSYAHVPYTGSTRVHDPLLYLNSVGYGYCDDMAFVLETIWRWQGYESRVWGLEGHVVPEINIDGHWRMYDPDFGVFYRTATGEVASVEELSQQPQLITNPVDPIYKDSQTAYSELLAGFYSTPDNRVSELGVMTAHPPTVVLPQGSSFVFPVKSDESAFAYDGETRVNPLYYVAQLRIPKVETDVALELPLFVVGISGTGEVEIDNQRFQLGSPELKEWFARFVRDGNYAEPTTTIKIYSGSTEVLINMSLSAFVVEGQMDAELEVASMSRVASSVAVSYSDASIATQVAQFLMSVSDQKNQANAYVSPVETGWTLDSLH